MEESNPVVASYTVPSSVLAITNGAVDEVAIDTLIIPESTLVLQDEAMYGLKNNNKVYIEGYSDTFNNNHLNNKSKFIGMIAGFISDTETANFINEFTITSIFTENTYNIGFGVEDFVNAVKENITIKHTSINGEENIIDLNTAIIPERTGLFDDGYMIISFNYNGKAYELGYTEENGYPLATGTLSDKTIGLVRTPTDWNAIEDGVQEIISTYNGKIIDSSDEVVVTINPSWKNNNITLVNTSNEKYTINLTNLTTGNKTINLKCDLTNFTGFDAVDKGVNYNFTLNFIGISQSDLENKGLLSKVENMMTYSGIKVNFLPDSDLPEVASINWNYTVDDDTGTITLNEYIGESTDVVVRNLYEADGKYYSNVVLGKNGSDGAFQKYWNTLKSISVEKGVKAATDSSSLFGNLRVLEHIDVTVLDVSETKNMNGIFQSTYLLETVDLSTWNTSACTTMNTMFNGSGVKTLDLSNFDMSKVTDINYCFATTPSLKSLNIDGWDVSKISNMEYLFNGCGLETLDLSSWNTESLLYMQSIFDNMASLSYINVNDWNVSGIKNLTAAFRKCPLLEEVDISTWDTSNVTTWDAIIYGCTNLKTVYVKDENTKTSIESTYYEQDTDIIVSEEAEEASLNWEYIVDDDANEITLTNYVGGSTDIVVKNKYLVNNTLYENVKIGKNSSSKSPFYNKRSSLTSIVFEKGIELPEDINALFNGCSNLTTLDVSNLDTSNVTNMKNLFKGCSKLTNLDISQWNVSSVTNMNYLFQNCYALTSLDISQWDVSSVTDMNGLFYNCSSLTSIDISQWDISSVTEMNALLSGCSALTRIYVKDDNTKTLIENTSDFQFTITVIVGSPS